MALEVGNDGFPVDQAQVEEVCLPFGGRGADIPQHPGLAPQTGLRRFFSLPPRITVTRLSASFYFSLAEYPFLTLQECECVLTRGDI